MREKIIKFMNNNKQYPVIAGIASGLYSILYYYSTNFTLINSWEQFTFFIVFFLIFPIVLFYLVYTFFKRIKPLNKYSLQVLVIANLGFFGAYALLSTFGVSIKRIIFVILVAVILSFFLKKHFKKIIVFQLLLAIVGFLNFAPRLYATFNYNDSWMKMADNIEDIQLKKKPNIYLIQPDGYANFSELEKDYHNFDNSEFKKYLTNNNFKTYDDFRSNYYSTLTSNTALFTMKHHYFYSPTKLSSEFFKAREIIVGENPVLSILKSNDYKTFFLAHKDYLLLNRPKLFYDYCNVDYSDIPYLPRGIRHKDNNVLQVLPTVMKQNKTTSNFFFIEQIAPGHIITDLNRSSGREQELKNYLSNLQNANVWLKSIIKIITDRDKNAMIVIAADHGGFAGLRFTGESMHKQTDPDLVNTVFTTLLAIKWPDNKAPEFDNKLKTNVNLFRILFSYLGEDKTYLKNLEEDKSYNVIEKGAPLGVYELIDEEGNVVFRPISK